MISVLAQERLLGFALGGTFMSFIVFKQRKSVYELISETQAQPEQRMPINEKKHQTDFAHLWNKTVDSTMGPIIVSLSSRGW